MNHNVENLKLVSSEMISQDWIMLVVVQSCENEADDDSDVEGAEYGAPGASLLLERAPMKIACQ